MLPFGLLRQGRLPVAFVVAGCMTFGMYGLLLLASLDLQQQRGASALVTGLELLPLPGLFAVLSPFIGNLVLRTGPRLPMTAGMAFMGAGLFAYAAAGGAAPLAQMELIFALLGLGLALNTGPVVGVAVASVSADRTGTASGIVNLARMLGATLGVAVLGALAAGGTPKVGAGSLGGLSLALTVGGGAEFAGAVLAWWGLRDRR